MPERAPSLLFLAGLAATQPALAQEAPPAEVQEAKSGVLSEIEFHLGAGYYGENLDIYSFGHNPSLSGGLEFPIPSTQFRLGVKADFLIPVSDDPRTRGGFGRVLGTVGREFGSLQVDLAGGYSADYLPILNAPTVGTSVTWATPVQIGPCALELSAAIYEDLIWNFAPDPAISAMAGLSCSPFKDRQRTSTGPEPLAALAEDPNDHVQVVPWTESYGNKVDYEEISVTVDLKQSQEVLRGTLDQLEEEMSKGLMDGNYKRAESNFRKYLLVAEHLKTHVSAEILEGGIAASNALGLVNDTYQRIQALVRQHGEAYAHYLLDFEARYGWVDLKVQKGSTPDFNIESLPFPPDERNAFAWVGEQLQDGEYTGLLPLNNYTLNGQAFKPSPLSEGGTVVRVRP